MAKINRSSITLATADVLALDLARDKPPTTIKDEVTPTYEIGPKITTVIKQGSNTATTALTIYTTPVDKDFYITYIAISVSKDVASDLQSVYLSVPTYGTQPVAGLILYLQTLTAESQHVELSFPHPIKVTRNTALVLNGTRTAGTMTKSAVIGGYLLE